MPELGIGQALRFAPMGASLGFGFRQGPAEETRAITGMEIGGVTVFGLPRELPIWVDSRVMRRERIGLGGGSRSSKVIAAPEILLKLPGAEVVEGLANDIVPSTPDD